MNPEFSKKLKILSFISIIGVLVAHSYFVENNAWEINAFIQDWIGCQIVRFCIPLFFFISGYLFFRETKDGGEYRKYWGKCVRGHTPWYFPIYYGICYFSFPLFFFSSSPTLDQKSIRIFWLCFKQKVSRNYFFSFSGSRPLSICGFFNTWFFLFCSVPYFMFYSIANGPLSSYFSSSA